MARKQTHCERALELLSDGEWHNHHEFYELRIVWHSRRAELLRRGYAIDHRQDGDTHWYRLVYEPVPAEQRSENLRGPAPRQVPRQRAEATTASEASEGWDDRARPELTRDGGHGQDVAPTGSADDARAEARTDGRKGEVDGGVPGSAATPGLSPLAAPPVGMPEPVQLRLEAA